jgi:hypothetical protein
MYTRPPAHQSVQQNAEENSKPNAKQTGTPNAKSLVLVHQIPNQQVVNQISNRPVNQMHSQLVHQMFNRPVHQMYIYHDGNRTAYQYIKCSTDQYTCTPKTSCKNILEFLIKIGVSNLHVSILNQCVCSTSQTNVTQYPTNE